MRHFFLVIIIIISLFSFQGVHAQQMNPLRVELNANLDMEDYNLVPCGKDGILVFFESNKKGNQPDTRLWRFAFYDNQLKQQWLADTVLIDGAKFRGHFTSNGHTWLFFLDSDRIKSTHNMHLMHVNYDRNEFDIINALAPDKAEPVYFGVFNNRAVIAVNDNRFEPRILLVDLSKEAEPKIIRPEVEGLNMIQSVVEKNGLIYVVLENYLDKRQNAIIIAKMNLEGQILKYYRINPALENKFLNDARLAYISQDTIIVAGTYHNDISRIQDNNNEEGIGSAGYFITRFTGGEETFIKYYNFLEFDEMNSSLNSKTIADIKRKVEKQKSKGEEYSMDYTLLVHDVIPFNGELVLLSEAFYPEYRTVTNMYYDYYGRPIPQTYTVFDGYKFITGIAASFSPDGELIWDSWIEIRDILTFKLSKHLSGFTQNDELALFYSNQNKIFYKIIEKDLTGNPVQNINLDNKYKGDKIMEDLGSKIIHWYDNYFLCYGYQKIKNNRISDSKRTIFYFSKLAFN